jgi:hypothetical protein
MIAADLIVGAIIGITFLATYIWAVVALLLVKKHTQELTDCFQNSPYFLHNAPSKHDSTMMRLRFFGIVAAGIAHPGWHEKKGLLNKHDFSILPASLKRKFQIMYRIQIILISSMITTFVIIKTGIIES